MKKYLFYSVILFIVSQIIISCSGAVVMIQKPSIPEALSETFNNDKILYTTDIAAKYSFGQSFSMSGEYMIVSARTANSNQGQAYILKNNGNNDWNNIAKLELSRKSDNDYFGYSVSIFGKYAIVGTPGYNSESGQVYIVKNDGADNWTEVATLRSKSPNKIKNHFFGCSVSLYGDYALVGANSTGKNMGLAYMFKNDGADNWKTIGIFKSDDKNIVDNFGYSVSLYKDYAIIGAPSADAGGKNRGKAYIFKNEGTDNWKKIAVLTASDQTDNDYFGRNVFIEGEHAVIGAPMADADGYNRGEAYIFKNDGADNWKESAVLKANDRLDEDYFGNSVSVSGDYVIVGAPGSNELSGQVYIFKNAGAENWLELDILKPNVKTLYHNFGSDVSISGKNMLVSALTATSEGEKRGVVYLFPQKGLSQEPHISFDKVEYDLGHIKQNGKYNFTFKFTNTGSGTLNIADVKSTCFCTVVDDRGKNTLEPGESTEIKGTFNSEQYKGKLERNIVVKTNDPDHPEVILYIKSFIEETK